MMRSRFLLLILVTGMIASIVGCGASTPEESARAGGLKRTPAVAVATPIPAPANPEAPTAAASTGIDTITIPTTTVGTAVSAPAGPIAFVDTFRMPMACPMAFEVMAIAMRDTVRLKSTDASDAAGFAATPAASAAVGDLRTLSILRFAHFGKADSPFAMHWTLYLPPGEGVLEGRALGRDRRTAGGDAYEVTLRGGLEFDLLLRGATQPMRLITHVEPQFKGTSKSWPPYGASVTLANGPIGFFYKNPGPNQRAPILVVYETKFTIGKRPTKYMAQPPKIARAQILDASGKPWTSGRAGGVLLEWKATSVAPVDLVGYRVYRAPATGGAWERIAQVEASRTQFIDSSYDGRTAVRYAVAHYTRYIPDFEHEGLIGPYVSVAAVQ